MSPSKPASYSMVQIILHWTIAVLIAFQLFFGEGIEELGEALRDGRTPDVLTQLMGNAHILVGTTILALMVLRIALRLFLGSPAPLPAPRWQHMAAAAVQGLLYALMILAPMTGLAAWYLGIRFAGEAHELMKPLFIVLISAHILGALWHQFVLKDRTVERVLRAKG